MVPLLTRLPLPRLAAVLEPRGRNRRIPRTTVERVVRAVDAGLARGKPVVRPGCLTRAVTRYWFLRRAGFDAVLVFGTTALVFIVTTIVSYMPTRKIARLEPTEALRGRLG